MKTPNQQLRFPVITHLTSQFQVWTWGAVLASALICGAISWLHFRQQQVLGQTVEVLRNIRQARIDLAKGFLHTSLAGDPASPFNRDQGLALLQQAVTSFDDALRWENEVSFRPAASDPTRAEMIAAFRGSVQVFRDRLATWSASPTRQPALETDLRTAFYDLERQADRVDAQIQVDLQALSLRNHFRFLLTLGVAALLLAGICAAIVFASRSQKKSEAALRQSEIKFQTLVESVPLKIFLKDRDSRYLSVNESYARDLHIRPKEAAGKTDHDFFPKELAEQYHSDDREVMQTGQTRVLDEKYLQDGSEVWVHTVKTPVRNENGEVTGVFGIFWDNTESKLAGEKLRLRESFLSAITENQPGLLWLKDTEGRFLMVNKTFATACGRGGPEQVHGLTDLDLWAKELAEKYRHDDQRVMSTGKASMVEEMISIGNSRVWHETFKTPVRDDQGRVIGTTGFAREITERKLVEEAVRESKDYLEKIINSVGDPMFVKDRQHRLVLVNEAECRLAGRTREELLGKTDYDFFPKEQVDVFWQKDELVFETGQVNVNEETITNAAGELRTVVTKKSRFLSPSGQAFIVGVIRDITERKQADNELRRSREEFKGLFDHAPVGFHELDTEGRIVRINNIELKMLGYSAEELLGQYVWKISAEEETSRRTVLAKLSGEMPPAEGFERMLRRKDGSTFPVLISDRLLKREDGAITGIHGAVQDITERKEAAQRVADELNFNQTVLRASPVGIVVFKAAGPCISANEAIGQILGGTREEVLKQNFRQLESWKSSGMLAAAEDALATQTERKLETQMLTTFGKNVWCFCRFAPFHYEGEPHLLLILSDITERKRAEETLREKEHLLSESQRIAHIGSWSWNLTGPIKWIDETYRIYGVSPETFTPTTESLVNLIHPDDRPMMQLWIEACAAGQSPGDLEFRTILPDGSVRLLSGRGKLIYDAENKPAFMIGTVQDITERKRAEDALRESQASLESAQSINRMGSWELDLAAGTGRWSKEMFHLFDRDPALGVPQLTDFLEMVHPEDRTRLLEAHQRVVESGEQCQQEFRTNPARGPICHFATIIQAVKESSGPVRRVAGTVQDITERKQAEERIREQAALLDAANDAIYVRTLDHTVTYWNDGAERLYGRTRAEVLGRKIIELGEVDREAFETAHAALLEQGNWSGELKKKNKAGKEIIVFCRWTLLRDESGRPKEVLAINTDITERKQLEANFLRAQRMEGIGALAGGIAHDLNNILQPILMTAPLLRATTSDPESREMLDTVKNCAQRGADIIKQLLTFARGEPSARVPLPVRHLLNEMSKLIQETFPKNIQLRVNVPKDLWLVLGDATQIHQALMNLCVNARDAMPDGGTLTLMAGNLILDEAFAAMMPSAKPGPHICVSVADTGMGIPPEHLGRIFDPFFTTKEIGKGTGLGLATVLGIARGHGGFVRVNSQAGKGTIFELYLPASSETKAAVSSEHETPPPRAGGELILVVDDEADVRGVIQRTLEKHGYRVLTAAEGTEAMGLFAQHRAEIRAVLTDMMMPDMDGPSLVRALRHLDPQLPIVGMTGVGEKADIKGLETLDLLVLLTKPFNSAVLLGVLHQALAAPRKANGKP